jgi:hypothetical protein
LGVLRVILGHRRGSNRILEKITYGRVAWLVLFTKNYSGYKKKDDMMGEACST